jgi:hypothetical protein
MLPQGPPRHCTHVQCNSPRGTGVLTSTDSPPPPAPPYPPAYGYQRPAAPIDHRAVHQQALSDVEGVLHDHAAHLRRSEMETVLQHYVFLTPRTQDSDARQPVKVYLRDVPAFCRAHGLSEKEMLRVARGEIDNHGGWSQGPISFLHCSMVSRALVVHRADGEERMRGAKKNQPRPTHPYTQATGPRLLPTTTFKSGL